MTKTRLVSDREILQTPDELVIRGRRKDVVVSVVLAGVTVPLVLGLIYQNIVGTADVAAVWKRSPGDQVFVVIALLVTALFFAVLPIVFVVASIRRRRRQWVFDWTRGQLIRLDERWPLADLREVKVEVVRGRWGDGSAAVLLHLGDAPTDAAKDAITLELSRYHAGKHSPLESCIREASDLANVVASFVDLPVRRPPPANRGFEVVLPSR